MKKLVFSVELPIFGFVLNEKKLFKEFYNKSTCFFDGKECKEPACEIGLLEVRNILQSLSQEYDIDGLALTKDTIIVHDHDEALFGLTEKYTFTYYYTGVDEYHVVPNMPSDYKYSIRKRIDGNRYYVDEVRR